MAIYQSGPLLRAPLMTLHQQVVRVTHDSDGLPDHLDTSFLSGL